MESNLAADRALRRITTVEVLRQLNLFETILHLYSMGQITDLEKQTLENIYNPELQRKYYLLTNVIPSRGWFRGMQLLQQALKQSEQFELLNILDKAYEDAVNSIVAGESFGLSQDPNPEASDPAQAAASNRCDSISSNFTSASDPDLVCTANNEDALRRDESLGRHMSFSSCSQSSSDDGCDTIPLENFPQQQQPQQLPLSPTISPSSSSSHIIIHVPLSQSTTVSVTPGTPGHRERSGHISFESNPYGPHPKRLEQSISVTINAGSQEEDTSNENHCRETVRRVDQVMYSTMKFVIVGDTATGKTSLLRRYISDKFSIASDPSTLLDVQSTELTCYNARYKLYLWDTAGQERFKALTKAYFRDAVGGFVVYDVTQKVSLEHCLQWKKEIDDVVQLSNGDPIPIVLIANKIDLGHLDGKQFSQEHDFTNYFETSAKTGVGIKEAIHFMVKKVHELSCANRESVVRTLSKHCSYSIKLHSHPDGTHIRKKCCT